MTRIRIASRLPDADSRLRRQTKPGLGIHPQPVRIALLVIIVASMLLLSACGPETAQGKITGAYQPLRSGMVQMYIVVELDDGTEVDAWLPQDQAVWDRVRKNLRVEIQREGGDDGYWEFVRFLDD